MGDYMKTISSFRNQYAFLSNFYNTPIIYKGLTYPNAESAFQAQKCTTDTGKIKYTLARTPIKAKQLGKKEPNIPKNWDDINVDIMREILIIKFSEESLKQQLLATEDCHLLEGNDWHDNFWGNCTCEKCKNVQGQNHLGKLLMEVRKFYLDKLV